MKRRQFLAAAAGLVAAPMVARAQSPTKVVLGVGGKPTLYYLPLTIAERKGYFVSEGLEVEINDFAGGAKALQSLIGGSVNVVTGAYEHTIRMQAKGQDVLAVCELGRFSGISVGVKSTLKDKVKSVADFKGLKVGVSAPGSSTHLTLLYAMSKVGLKPTDVSIIGVGGGAGAVAAFQQGEIDAMSNSEPIITKLEQTGDLVVMVDNRTEAGTLALFGAPCPAASLYTKRSYIEQNPEVMQKLTNAFLKTLHWLSSAKPEEVAEIVPPAYLLGDKDLYIRAVRVSMEAYSRNGIITPSGMNAVYNMLKAIDPEFQTVTVDLGKTFSDRFVKAAKV